MLIATADYGAFWKLYAPRFPQVNGIHATRASNKSPRGFCGRFTIIFRHLLSHICQDNKMLPFCIILSKR